MSSYLSTFLREGLFHEWMPMMPPSLVGFVRSSVFAVLSRNRRQNRFHLSNLLESFSIPWNSVLVC